MKKLVLFVVFILFSSTLISQGQGQGIGAGCANERIPFSDYQKYGTIIHPKSYYAMAGVNYVPIKLHVLRTNSGTTSFNQEEFMVSFMELNQLFKNIDIQFYLLPDINYINNTGYYDLNADQEEEGLCSVNDVNNAVNLYLTNSIVFSYGFNATGYAYYPSPVANSNRIFVTNAAMASGGKTLTHEFGHYFNLLHTFRGNNAASASERELVTRGSGSNCQSAGDFLCDTPADPYGLFGATTNGCSYNGTAVDANGMQYDPQITNTMSYYSSVCGFEFSQNQSSRLEEGYSLRNSPSNQYSIAYTDPGIARPTGLTASASQAGILLTFQDNATDESGYIVERAMDAAGPFEPINFSLENEDAILDQDLISNTTFYYRVRAINGIEYTNVANATTGTFYCQPNYLQSCNQFEVVIEQFSIQGTALSNLNSGCSANNYGKFTNMIPDLEKGDSYTFTASATTTSNTPYFAQSLKIWVDFDQNGFFDNDEEVYGPNSGPGMNPSVSNLINIPTTAETGLTMMRVRTQYAFFGNEITPCGDLEMGEAEDYVINITSPVVNNEVQVTSVSPLAVCRGGEVNINYVTTGGDFTNSTEYVVQIDNKNGQFLDLPTQKNGSGSLTATIPTSYASGTNFNIRVVATNPAVTSSIASDKLTVNIVPITPTLTINSPTTSICEGSTVSVNAAGCTGTVNWSNNLTGNPITFTVNEPVTITANCTANGCTGATSLPMSITTKPLPDSPILSVSGGNRTFCSGETVSLNAGSCSGTVTWSNNSTGSSISFVASSSTSLTATCRVNGCESEPSTPIAISVNQRPSAPVLSSTTTNYCVGETVTLNAGSCSGTVTWSNNSTGSSISFVASSSMSLTATCRVNGCESEPSTPIAISVNQRPSAPVLSSTTTNYCVGETVTLNAGSCSGTVTWSNNSTGSSISFVASSSTSLTATCRVNGCESESSSPIAISVNSAPTSPNITVEGGSLNHCIGESVKLIASNCAGTVKWNNELFGNSVTIVVETGVSYSATCTINTCESTPSNTITFECISTGSKVKAVALDLRVILEGPYNQSTGLMSTTYNSQGLLPGQTPISLFGVATPVGQPYNRTPWNYSGSENVINYSPTVVDWVLISLKNDGNEILYQSAALLHADSQVELIEVNPQLDTTLTYFVQIDHRNHLGVMSASMLPVINAEINYDFTSSDSYIKPNNPAFGQKFIGSKYAMFVGDIDKSSAAQHYDINFADITKLRNNLGLFEQYLDADLNLDADINFNDLIIWRANSGKFSSITY